MTKIEKEPEMPLPIGQLVKMTAPILIFGVTLPLVDMVTDLRMIIRLYVGVPRCAVKETSLPLYYIILLALSQRILAHTVKKIQENVQQNSIQSLLPCCWVS